jgi:hypothetical protein
LFIAFPVTTSESRSCVIIIGAKAPSFPALARLPPP